MDTRSLAKWIWLPGFIDTDPVLPAKFVLFRKTFELQQVPTSPCEVHVSADTRYRLFVNGKSVAFGPCKSYPTRWYYETIDLAPFLRAGVNIITAKVLRFHPGQIGSSSLMKANVPGFFVWGDIDGVPLVSDETWHCKEEPSIRIQSRAEWNYILGPPFLSMDERVDLSKAVSDWQAADTDLSGWFSAVPAVTPIKMMPAMEPWKLFKRPIPLFPEIPRSFKDALRNLDPAESPSLEQWNSLITTEIPINIGANVDTVVEFESDVLTTGFMELDFEGGLGTQITILYAESYEKDLVTDKAPFPMSRKKTNRRNWHSQRLYGNEDHVTVASRLGEKARYEPFWFRTFRFIRLSITCKDAPITINRIGFRETHYPLHITTEIQLPPEYKQIWDICLNTLRNCMHETYEDCPFYEQNQFAMDGRLQLLFTYQLSRDDRLARKTIHEFHASRRDDGLLETNFPVSFRAINIPQFSLFWVLMLHDHMTYFGEASFLRKYMGTMDGILQHFESLVTQDGLVGAFDPECWAFIDWVNEWHGSKGIRDMAVPPIYKETGVAAYNSLLYSWVLQHAAELCTFLGRHDTANEYQDRAVSLNDAVRKHCWDGNWFLDGPGSNLTCEHTQVFAVLAGAIIDTEAQTLMSRTLSLPKDDMPRCSYAMKHYVFRALAKTGSYEQYFDTMMQPWKQMIADNLTTCAEDDVSFRSDCHGWSASPIYEFIAEVCGIKPVVRQVGKGQKISVLPRKGLLRRFGAGGGAGVVKLKVAPESEVVVKWNEDGDVVVEGNDGVLIT